MMDSTTRPWALGLGATTMAMLACATASATGDEIKLSDCPAAVQKTLKRESNGAKIDDLEKETEDDETTYEAEVTIDGKKYAIIVAEDGTLLEKALDDEDDGEDGDEADEVEVKLSDCPAAVRKTLAREAGGATIEVVDKETKDDKAIYEVDVKIDGKSYEIRVADDGTLISKVLDDEEG